MWTGFNKTSIASELKPIGKNLDQGYEYSKGQPGKLTKKMLLVGYDDIKEKEIEGVEKWASEFNCKGTV